ncbi:hypothetical protein VNO77_20436 [Canavalia gladiata]|uniref:UspA domain-containing protein n=1 Tax=Canavalia gladiata TaxID=3824 RepID=A0AAN9QL98_CANGL
MVNDWNIGVALGFSNRSKNTLKWAIENLADKGDTFYIIHIKPNGAHESRDQLWAKSDSPLIPLRDFKEPGVMKSYGVQIDVEILDLLNNAVRQKEVNVIAKLYCGDARQKLLHSIEDLKLDTLVMGSRGLNIIQSYQISSVGTRSPFDIARN